MTIRSSAPSANHGGGIRRHQPVPRDPRIRHAGIAACCSAMPESRSFSQASLLGLFWKRTTMLGVFAGLIAGIDPAGIPDSSPSAIPSTASAPASWDSASTSQSPPPSAPALQNRDRKGALYPPTSPGTGTSSPPPPSADTPASHGSSPPPAPRASPAIRNNSASRNNRDSSDYRCSG